MDISCIADNLYLPQARYDADLLLELNMATWKPSPTPLQALHLLDFLFMMSRFIDATTYRGMVGDLKYPALTQTNIALAVNHVYQFMQTPLTPHLQAVKHYLSIHQRYSTTWSHFS